MSDVIVGDDDPNYRFLIRMALEGEPDLHLVGDAGSADELVEVARRRRPDIVLLDASLPRGIASAARLRDVAPGTRVVLTSSLPARSVAGSVAAARAVGSLAKDVPVRRIPDALREMSTLVAVAERAVRTAEASLAMDRRSPRQSRELARLALEGWCDDGILTSIELLVSELVTNGVLHARTVVDVRIAVGRATVRVEVADHNPSLPVMRSPGLDASSGRGLRNCRERRGALGCAVPPQRQVRVVHGAATRVGARVTDAAELDALRDEVVRQRQTIVNLEEQSFRLAQLLSDMPKLFEARGAQRVDHRVRQRGPFRDRSGVRAVRYGRCGAAADAGRSRVD